MTEEEIKRSDVEVKKKNKELIDKYPFLAFKEYNFDTGSYYIPDDYDYKSTWLDSMLDGWRIAFGEQLCQELKDALDEFDYTDKYIILQVKEKYGGLRIYDNGIPVGCLAHDIIRKYEDISYDTCIRCGKPATKMSLVWICPYCDDCANKIGGRYEDIVDDD